MGGVSCFRRELVGSEKEELIKFGCSGKNSTFYERESLGFLINKVKRINKVWLFKEKIHAFL